MSGRTDKGCPYGMSPGLVAVKRKRICGRVLETEHTDNTAKREGDKTTYVLNRVFRVVCVPIPLIGIDDRKQRSQKTEEPQAAQSMSHSSLILLESLFSVTSASES